MRDIIRNIEMGLPDFCWEVRQLHPREHWVKDPDTDKYLAGLRPDGKFKGAVLRTGQTPTEALGLAYEAVLLGTGAGADM
jgi:hypothetical protein